MVLYLRGSSKALYQGLESFIPPCLALCTIVYPYTDQKKKTKKNPEPDRALSRIYSRRKRSLRGDTGLQVMRTAEVEETCQ